MKEYPILFSGPLVRAILDGRKTQTRRVCNYYGDPDCSSTGFFIRLAGGRCIETDERALPYCPYGQPGDRLWVRESFLYTDNTGEAFAYRATDAGRWDGPWKPSIHMPRKACRLLLDVTDVRVERLHDITEDEAKAEGVEAVNVTEPGDPYETYSHRLGFHHTWDRLNGKRGYPWASNPWVWVVSFNPAT